MSKRKEILSRLWSIIIDQLKGKLIKLALKKFLGSGAAVGFKAWIITFIISNLYDELAVPFFLYLKRKGLLLYDKRQGQILIKELKDAKASNDENRYNDVVDKL